MRYRPLRHNSEFGRVYARGKAYVDHALVLYVLKTRAKQTRVGLTATKKVGCAVRRNRARRVMKAAIDEHLDYNIGGYNLIFVARAATPGLSAPPGTTNRFMGGQPFARGYLRSRQIFQAAAPRARADAHLTVVFINKASLETFSRSLWLLQRFLQTFCGGRILRRGALPVPGFEIEPAQLTYPS